MLVQDYLKKHGLEKLQEEYGIKTTAHEDGRIILNYDQIESPKRVDVVEECRGLVLDSNFDLVARSFKRFYNLGEIQTFDFEGSVVQEKVDGSLLNLFNWNDEPHMTTRGSFGDGNVHNGNLTWKGLLKLAEPEWESKVKSLGNINLVCELCSPYNQVVKYYNEPVLYVLSSFQNSTELPLETTRDICNDLGFWMPYEIKANSIDECVKYTEELNQNYRTSHEVDEGIVVRNVEDNRCKIKNTVYLCYHRTLNNGYITSPKNAVPLILSGEIDEILAYFPAYKEPIMKMKAQIDSWYDQLDKHWFCYHGEKNAKKFALAIKDCPLNGILFRARRYNMDWKELFYHDGEIQSLIIKKLKGKK